MEIISHFPYKIHLKGEFLVMKPNVSEEEFWEISNEDSNYELLDGVLYIHSPANTEYEEIFKYLLALLKIYFEIHQGGKVFGSRLVMRLSKDWNPEPDLMVISEENFEKIKETKIEGPADLVIEILSYATREIDLKKKVPKYLEAGVKEIWIVDPKDKKFTQKVFHENKLKEETWKFEKKSKEGDKIISKILPKIDFNPNWIWERDSYPIHKMFLHKSL